MNDRILVWDLPPRVFHWVLAASFAGAFLTAESERLRDLHLLFGYTFAAAIAFRLVWGFVGTRHARFSSLRFGPGDVRRYLVSLVQGRAEPHAGHSPVGMVTIPLLLGLGIAVAASGWAVYSDLGGEWLGPGMWPTAAARAPYPRVSPRPCGAAAFPWPMTEAKAGGR